MRIARTWRNLAILVLVYPIRVPVLSALYALDKSLEFLSWRVNDVWGWFYDRLPCVEFERTQKDIDAEEARRADLIRRLRVRFPAPRAEDDA